MNFDCDCLPETHGGPEMLTLTLRPNERYELLVHNFDCKDAWSAQTDFGESNATLTLYTATNEPHTITVPTQPLRKMVWEVCTIVVDKEGDFGLVQTNSLNNKAAGYLDGKVEELSKRVSFDL